MIHKLLLIFRYMNHNLKWSYTFLKIFILFDPLSKSKCSIIYLEKELVLKIWNYLWISN